MKPMMCMFGSWHRCQYVYFDNRKQAVHRSYGLPSGPSTTPLGSGCLESPSAFARCSGVASKGWGGSPVAISTVQKKRERMGNSISKPMSSSSHSRSYKSVHAMVSWPKESSVLGYILEFNAKCPELATSLLSRPTKHHQCFNNRNGQHHCGVGRLER